MLQRAFIAEPKATGTTETHEMASDAQHEAAEQLATTTTEPFVEATADVVNALSVEEATPAQEELQTPPSTPAETATDATDAAAPSHGAIEAAVAAATTSTTSSGTHDRTRVQVCYCYVFRADRVDALSCKCQSARSGVQTSGTSSHASLDTAHSCQSGTAITGLSRRHADWYTLKCTFRLALDSF